MESGVQPPAEEGKPPAETPAQGARRLIAVFVTAFLAGLIFAGFVTLLERPVQYAEPELEVTEER